MVYAKKPSHATVPLNSCAICILQKTLKIFRSYCFAFMLSPAFSSQRECPPFLEAETNRQDWWRT